MRIISLLPAATEIVWALGLADDLVGVSHACDFPPGVVGRPILTQPSRTARAGAAPEGQTGPAPGFELRRFGEPARDRRLAEVDLGALGEAHPDLVLVGSPPARRPGATARSGDRDGLLRAVVGPDASIVTLEPESLEGVFHAIATVGAMTDAEDEAVGLVEILRERLADVEEVVEARRVERRHAPRVVTLDGFDPPSSAGLWVPEQIRRAGGWELLGNDGEPSIDTSWTAIAEVDPEMIVLAPSGLHLPEAVRAWRAVRQPARWDELQAVRRGQVFALDAAAYVGRPGPRLIDGIEILAEIFDPEAFVDLAPVNSWVPLT